MAVSDTAQKTYYLDAIFSSIRAFAEELEASRKWLARAEETENQTWRLAFLHEARCALERVPKRLGTLRERLSELGPPGCLPPPFDRIERNLLVMHADLDGHERRILGLETKVAEKAAPIGVA